jgi:RNA polymerase sigma-70 factor (ECF subfamily)
MLTAATAARPRPVTCGDADLEAAVAEFDQVRPRLVRIAARILGSWTDAEDIVQDAWLRWQACDRTAVSSPTAFLVTTTTRLAITAATSARARHETSVGGWLTEPVDAADAPALRVERTEALELGFVLLRRLLPTERAAYVLRHAFDYPYPLISEILHTSEANARQLVSRAGKRLASGRGGADGTLRPRSNRTHPPRAARPRRAPSPRASQLDRQRHGRPSTAPHVPTER